MRHHRLFAIAEPSQIGEARRAAASLSADVNLDPTESGRVSIVLTETATNILHHAKRGEIILSIVDDGPRRGLELLAIDRGPGMGNVAACFADGYSTLSGSPGEGLGAIARLASELDIYSRPDSGTVLMARFFGHGAPASSLSRLEIGGVAIPYVGERECGDAWATIPYPQCRRLIVTDGLGHGPDAAAASRRAIEVFEATASLSIHEVIDQLHAAMKRTRGAAIAIADVHAQHRTVSFAGIGNISGTIMSTSSSQSLVSINGTIGVAVRKIQVFEYELPRDAVLVMHSDGLTTHWSFAPYPGLLRHHPSVIAGVLYRDHRRVNNDDATVVVVKEREAA